MSNLKEKLLEIIKEGKIDWKPYFKAEKIYATYGDFRLIVVPLTTIPAWKLVVTTYDHVWEFNYWGTFGQKLCLKTCGQTTENEESDKQQKEEELLNLLNERP